METISCGLLENGASRAVCLVSVVYLGSQMLNEGMG
jgi:hypothetical protein